MSWECNFSSQMHFCIFVCAGAFLLTIQSSHKETVLPNITSSLNGEGAKNAFYKLVDIFKILVDMV